MNSPKYHAGRIMGMRDAQANRPSFADRTASKDFRAGYSDGYHKGKGGELTW